VAGLEQVDVTGYKTSAAEVNMRIELKDMLRPVLTTLALLLGIAQYRWSSYDDFVKPVREAELKVYLEVSDTAARIAILPKGSPDRDKSRTDFLRVYYGSLTMLRDFDHCPQANKADQDPIVQKTPDDNPTVERFSRPAWNVRFARMMPMPSADWHRRWLTRAESH
jgi:hypothetical protein